MHNAPTHRPPLITSVDVLAVDSGTKTPKYHRESQTGAPKSPSSRDFTAFPAASGAGSSSQLFSPIDGGLLCHVLHHVRGFFTFWQILGWLLWYYTAAPLDYYRGPSGWQEADGLIEQVCICPSSLQLLRHCLRFFSLASLGLEKVSRENISCAEVSQIALASSKVYSSGGHVFSRQLSG